MARVPPHAAPSRCCTGTTNGSAAVAFRDVIVQNFFIIGTAAFVAVIVGEGASGNKPSTNGFSDDTRQGLTKGARAAAAVSPTGATSVGPTAGAHPSHDDRRNPNHPLVRARPAYRPVLHCPFYRRRRVFFSFFSFCRNWSKNVCCWLLFFHTPRGDRFLCVVVALRMVWKESGPRVFVEPVVLGFFVGMRLLLRDQSVTVAAINLYGWSFS
nr:hypothetical protein [Pandoravirus massiliensis]